MKYFEQGVSRIGTQSIKWDALKENFGDASLLPMWIADMDFPVHDHISAAIRERAAHPVYGYTCRGENFYKPFLTWVEQHHWKLSEEWIQASQGVVSGFALAVESMTHPGDHILIQTPVYYPFKQVIESCGRHAVSNSLKLVNGQYQMDFDDLAAKAADPRVTMMVLCNPHNPVGRAFSAAELTGLGEICQRYGIIVFSDEIHCDIVMPGHRHTCFAALDHMFSMNSVTAMAASKTFNTAGLQTSAIIIPNPRLRNAFAHRVQAGHFDSINPFAAVAFPAAYRTALETNYVAELVSDIEGNYLYLKQFLEKHIAQIKTIELEGTYLVWLDCRDLNLSDAQLSEYFLKCGIACDGGVWFGDEGSGFMRMNIACPQSMLNEALQRLRYGKMRYQDQTQGA